MVMPACRRRGCLARRGALFGGRRERLGRLLRQDLRHFFWRQLHQLGHFPLDLDAQRAFGNCRQQGLGFVQAAGPPLGLGHVVARCQLIQEESRQSDRLAQASTERLGPQLADIGIRVVLGWKEQETNRDIVPEHRQASLQCTPGGSPPCPIPVKAEDHLVACAQQLLHVVWRGGGAQCRNGIGNALLRQADHIHVALDHDDLPFLTDGQPRFP
ncbi:hypothetical protein D3C72_1609820 [compost metagenome]